LTNELQPRLSINDKRKKNQDASPQRQNKPQPGGYLLTPYCSIINSTNSSVEAQQSAAPLNAILGNANPTPASQHTVATKRKRGRKAKDNGNKDDDKDENDDEEQPTKKGKNFSGYLD
jgi:hypothetical protein